VKLYPPPPPPPAMIFLDELDIEIDDIPPPPPIISFWSIVDPDPDDEYDNNENDQIRWWVW
jgi:hypothetical protein